ncbi:BQ2448_233 [Microbotryum intermedium]|uniref:BQ2448_233 protein n=1 Tax=Microbotryum intermedium TaxID=269621 RepID=A0A238F1W1_9BASI|nr:BQ2448_233 [Microbotryum intermedium]
MSRPDSPSDRSVHMSLLSTEGKKVYDLEDGSDDLIMPIRPGEPVRPRSWRVGPLSARVNPLRIAFVVGSFLLARVVFLPVLVLSTNRWSRAPTSQCVIVMQGGFENSGLGDYIGSFARVLLAAKRLGCVYVPQHVWSEHGYIASNILHRQPLNIKIDSIQTCDLSDVLDIDYLHDLEGVGCEVPLKAMHKTCNVISYNPKGRILTGNKIHCIQDEWKKDWETIRGRNRSVTHTRCGPENSAAIHHRYGDVSLDGDTRALNRRELQDLYDVATKVAGIEPLCVTVVAEGYEKDQIDWIDGPHIVANTTDVFEAIDIMSSAKVFGVSASSFMPIILPVAKAETLIMLEHRRCDFGLVAKDDTRQLIIRERRGRLKEHLVGEDELYREMPFRQGCSHYID